jgi:precorrin-2 dehydrogenase/sirohydrochlorin ferrochelatase
MFIDLNLEGKRVLILGGGVVGERKAKKIVRSNSKITIASKNFTKNLKELSQKYEIKLVNTNHQSIDSLISNSDLVIAATDDENYNEKIVLRLKNKNILVSSVDNPSISDFIIPFTKNVGDIIVGIGTGGKSPLMAKLIGERLKKHITNEDFLQVKLQHYARTLLKNNFSNKKDHQLILYQILNNHEISQFLKKNNLEEAKRHVGKIIKLSI